MPWQYYQAPFEVNKSWKKINISFESFKRSGIMLAKKFNPRNVKSIAIVAFGKNHKVDIEVDEISFY